MPQPYGQHFLRHVPHQLLHAITKIPPKTKFHVLEVGPGRGAVTQEILKLMPYTAPGSTLTLVEIDPKFIPRLQTIIAPYNRSHLKATIHQQDFLKFNLSIYWQKIPPTEPTIIIGSLPYQSSKRIINYIVKTHTLLAPLIIPHNPNFHPKINKTSPLDCSFIIQKEVAQAYTATVPRTTFLSSWLHTFTTNIKAHTTIKPKQFSPPPKVTSQILSFSQPTHFNPLSIHQFFKKDSRPMPPLTNTLQAQKTFMIHTYTNFLHQMFRYPRKKIRTAWQQYCLQIPKNVCYDLRNNDISAIINQRAGEITSLQFQQLFNESNKI